MDAHAIAEQARIEHEILKHITNALQVSLAWDTGGAGFTRKLSSVRFVTQSLQRHLDRQLALEECDGYMSVVLETHPDWSDRIDWLKREHDEIRSSINRIVANLESLSHLDESAFDEACDDIRNLLDQLAEHGKKEGELLEEAFLQEEVGLD